MSEPDKVAGAAYFQSSEIVAAVGVTMPDFWKGLADEDRQRLAEKIGRQAEKKLGWVLQCLKRIVRSCNPIQLISHFQFYDCTFLEKSRGEGYSPIEQFGIEFLQALILSIPPNELCSTPPDGRLKMRTNRLLRAFGRHVMMRELGKTYPQNESERQLESLRLEVKAHTFAVRNSGFQQQTLDQLRGLFAPFDERYEQAHGLRLSRLTTMWENLSKEISSRIERLRSRLLRAASGESGAEVIRLYAESCESEAERARFAILAMQVSSFEEAMFLCHDHHDFWLHKIYIFTLGDFAKAYGADLPDVAMKRVLKKWSHILGQLTGWSEQRFLLDNPVWSRPIVEMPDDEFFWPIPQTFHSFGLEMMEGLIADNANWSNEYQSRVRGNYLEETVAKLLRQYIHESRIYTNLVWREGEQGKEFETDLLLILDRLAVVVECKSGRITQAARRGAPERLRREVRKLIDEASIQSRRLESRLLRAESLTLKASEGVLEVSKGQIQLVIRLTVTLDFFGPLACDSISLKEAGLLDPSATGVITMALSDLELVLLMLKDTPVILHYLHRRSQFEANVPLTGDELDLLAFYMANRFNIGDYEFSGNGLHLSALAQQLEPYLMAREVGIDVAKPQQRCTPWFELVLNKLTALRVWNWLEVSFVILSITNEDQTAFVDAMESMRARIAGAKPGELKENLVVLLNGPPQRRNAILAIGIRNVTEEHRKGVVGNAVQSAFDNQDVHEVLYFVIDVDDTSTPFTHVGYCRRGWNPIANQGGT